MLVLVLLFLFVVNPCNGSNKNTDGLYIDIVIKALEIAQRESFKSNELNWHSLKNDVIKRYAASNDKKDAYAAIELLIKSINDNHSFLSVNGVRFGSEVQPLSNNVEHLTIKSSLDNENIAYIHIPRTVRNDVAGMDEYAKNLYTEIAYYSNINVSAFILDFRYNSGGQLWPMLAGLSALINSKHAGTAIFPDGPRWQWWAHGGEAGTRGKNFKNVNHSIKRISPVDFDNELPIAILISGLTGSSGEASVISFLGNKNTCLIGQRSRAQATINQPFKLDDTTRFFIARGYFGNNKGDIYQAGISPNISVHKDNDSNILKIARSWLTGKRNCG